MVEDKISIERHITNIQDICRAELGVTPSREQVFKHIGEWEGRKIPGLLNRTSPPWMMPIMSDRVVKSN